MPETIGPSDDGLILRTIRLSTEDFSESRWGQPRLAYQWWVRMIPSPPVWIRGHLSETGFPSLIIPDYLVGVMTIFR